LPLKGVRVLELGLPHCRPLRRQYFSLKFGAEVVKVETTWKWATHCAKCEKVNKTPPWWYSQSRIIKNIHHPDLNPPDGQAIIHRF